LFRDLPSWLHIASSLALMTESGLETFAIMHGNRAFFAPTPELLADYTEVLLKFTEAYADVAQVEQSLDQIQPPDSPTNHSPAVSEISELDESYERLREAYKALSRAGRF